MKAWILTILVLGTISCLVLAVSLPEKSSNVEKGLAELKKSDDYLKTQFDNSVKQFFVQEQKSADELMVFDKKTGYLMKKISNLITKVQFIRYAIARQLNSRLRKVLEEQNKDSQDEKLILNKDMIELLLLRAKFRGKIESFRYSMPVWNKLHVLIERSFSNEKVSPILKNLIIASYVNRYKMVFEAVKLVEAMGKYEIAHAQNTLSSIDSLIDNAMDCPDCAKQHPLGGMFFAIDHLMLPDENSVNELIETHVDGELREAMDKSESNLLVADETLDTEADRVQVHEVGKLQDDVLNSAGLLKGGKLLD